MGSHKELLGASTTLLILSVLAQEASYGYEIIRRMNARANGKFLWREGTVYPLLHKLEREGLLRTQWQQTENERKRKYYYITARGRAALEEQKRTWKLFNDVVSGITGESHA
jgi:PadR family transcriptional regulator, regulatory protein PadR